ncbi:MAG: serine/threonine-protein phosphatase [Nitrospirae bacterium]|nr:serine/threonine-protein phosphatase [Nitrospirota bacterium]
MREAARFQRKYLTNSEHTGSILKNAKLNAAFFNKPATDVSGDFWFYKRMPKGKAGLFVADTCGHGVLAALMSIQVLSIVDNCPAPNRHPSECLMSVNTDIYGLLSPEHSFVAAMYLVFDQNKLVLSNAGQPAPLLLRGTEVTELKLSGLPLGMSSELDFDEIEHDFIKGDRLIIYSDGLPESTNVQGEPFGAERIITHLQKNSSLSVRDMKNSLISELQRFTNCEFDDDITLIIIEREHDLDEFLNRNNINGIKEEKNADS